MLCITRWIIPFVFLVSLVISSCGGGGGGSSATLEGFIGSSLLVDVDKDGDLDLLADPCCDDNRTSIPVFINDGSGNFTEKSGAMPDRKLRFTVAMQSADFNNDGFIDILASSQDLNYTETQLELYFGNGDGTFTDGTSKLGNLLFDGFIGSLWAGDFDNDGRVDFLVTAGTPDYGGPRGIYLQDSNGDFSLGYVSPFEDYGPAAYEIMVGDLDNDGDLDLVPSIAENDSDIASVWPWGNLLNTSSQGNLSFSRIASTETEFEFSERDNKGAGVLIDINNDTFLDLITSGGIAAASLNGVAPLAAYLNDGAGSFDYDNSVFVGSIPSVQHAVHPYLASDFNLDGRNDLFIPDHGFDAPPFPGARNWLLINTESGLEDKTVSNNLGTTNTFTHGASVGDVNNDGYPDLFLNDSNRVSGFQGRLWFNNGGVSFTESNSGL